MAARLEMPGDVIRTIPNGISLDGFAPEITPPSSATIGFLARFIEEKGLGLVVDAFIELKRRGSFPEARLRCAGAMSRCSVSMIPFGVSVRKGRLRLQKMRWSLTNSCKVSSAPKWERPSWFGLKSPAFFRATRRCRAKRTRSSPFAQRSVRLLPRQNSAGSPCRQARFRRPRFFSRAHCSRSVSNSLIEPTFFLRADARRRNCKRRPPQHAIH